MSGQYRDFLELPYEELEELNLAAKDQRRKRVSIDKIQEERLKYLTDTRGIKAVTVVFSDLEGRLHMLDYDKKFLVNSWDNLTFDGSSIRGFTAQRESDLRLGIDWAAFYWTPADVFGAGKVIVFGEVIDKNGGTSSKIKFVEIPFPQMEPALVAGKVDAISVQEPFAAVAARKPETRVLSNPWGDVTAKFLIASWFASEKWIQKNKSTAQAFVRAINRGIDAIHADKEGARAAMIKWAGLNPDMVGKIGLPLFEKAVNEKDVQATIDLTIKYKFITRALKAREVISDIAPKA